MIAQQGQANVLESARNMQDQPSKYQRIAALLRDGIAVARKGQHAQARRLFEAVLRLDARNEEAILWWAGLAQDPQVTLIALAQVLKINPHNQRARAGMLAVHRQLSVSSASLDAAEMPPEEETSSLPEQPAAAPTSASVPGRRLNALLVGLTLLVLALACVLVAVALPDAPRAVLAAFYPSPTFTSTATPTATFTPTATPTPTATATWTPSPTPSVTPTPAPTLAFAVPLIYSAPTEDKWIDIDLSDQRLVAYVGIVPVYAIRISTGVSRYPTLTGEFHIYRKLTSTTMAGPGYYLTNVPWTMYYDASYAIHGTYWHDNFGHPMSHGCVNLPTPDAKWLFEWAPEGTLVVIHD